MPLGMPYPTTQSTNTAPENPLAAALRQGPRTNRLVRDGIGGIAEGHPGMNAGGGGYLGPPATLPPGAANIGGHADPYGLRTNRLEPDMAGSGMPSPSGYLGPPATLPGLNGGIAIDPGTGAGAGQMRGGGYLGPPSTPPGGSFTDQTVSDGPPPDLFLGGGANTGIGSGQGITQPLRGGGYLGPPVTMQGGNSGGGPIDPSGGRTNRLFGGGGLPDPASGRTNRLFGFGGIGTRGF